MTTNDHKIFDAILDDKEKGFRMLMAKYEKPVYWYIRRIVEGHDDAQDATQETFMCVFRSIDQCRDTNSLRSWIFRIATNEALRLVRSRREVNIPIDENRRKVDNVTADNYVDYTDLEEVKLQKAISSLPTKQQMAFNMRYYENMDYREIAKAMESSVSAVKSNYHFAKSKIIKYLSAAAAAVALLIVAADVWWLDMAHRPATITTEDVDKAFDQLSSEEQDYILNTYQDDVFMDEDDI